MPAPSSSRVRRATLWLLLVTAIWGASFLWTETGMDAASDLAGARRVDPRTVAGGAATLFVAGRFTLAWLALLLLGRLVPRTGLGGRADAALRRGAGLYALPILSGFLLQTLALGELDAAVSAFLTSAYVSLTALLTALLERRLPTRGACLGIALATFGAGFIDGPPQVSFGAAEWMTLLSAGIFATGILMTDRLTKRHDPVVLTRVSMGFVTLGALAVLGLQLAAATPTERELLLDLATHGPFLTPLLLNAALANVVALTLINVWQRELDPVRAAILYSLEPVWTAVWVFVAVGASPSSWLWIGGSALLVGNLVAELAPRWKSARQR